eukprot:16062619-Heterocapsa_arctica.AAC.1
MQLAAQAIQHSSSEQQQRDIARREELQKWSRAQLSKASDVPIPGVCEGQGAHVAPLAQNAAPDARWDYCSWHPPGIAIAKRALAGSKLRLAQTLRLRQKLRCAWET